jgi:organic radical activating enzyme
MNKWLQQQLKFKDTLNAISPSFCLAKWKQVTIHLQTGHNHSCHHPRTHVIPILEIKKSPSSLHNTLYKQEQRQLMIDGHRPAECDYCWKVEDSGPAAISDRVLKSSAPWANKHIDEVVASGTGKNIFPSQVEVSFSHACNFKCSYCMPSVSSQWMEEIERYGPYPTSNSYNNLEWVKQQNKMPIPLKEHNPYIDAFWEWWPNLSENLEIFRITGGEPLLSKETFRVLDSLISNPKPQISIQINSNLCVPSELFEKFISKLMILQHTNDIVVHTSAEAHGARAEYIRHGMNYNQWLDNCEYFLEKVQRGKLNIMSTYNALSVTSYTEFLKDVYRLNKKYSSRFIFFKSRNAVSLDIPYLNNPKHQTVEILTKDFLPLIDQQILFMKEHEHYLGFSEDETQKLSRLLSVFRPLVDNTDNEVQLMIDRRDFAIFVDEHDKRRGTNFLKTFPEMEEFYNLCKAINY